MKTPWKLSRPAALFVAPFGVLCFLLLLPPIAAGQSQDDLWVHITIEQDRDSEIEINLPFGAVESAARLVPRSHRHPHWLVWNVGHGGHLHARDFHRMVDFGQELGRNEERRLRIRGQSYQVRRTDNTLRVIRPGRFFREKVELRISLPVALALTSGSRNEIDWPAGLRALADLGTREEIAVSDDDGKTVMRLFIDQRSSS